MGFFKQNSRADFTGKVIQSTGTSIPIGIFLMVSVDNGIVTLRNSDLSFRLLQSQITYSYISFEENTIMQNKNVVGRGIAGAALAGTVGAVVGSTSGIGSKRGVDIKHYMYLNFCSSEGIDCQLVFFLSRDEFRKADKFAKQVNPSQSGTVSL